MLVGYTHTYKIYHSLRALSNAMRLRLRGFARSFDIYDHHLGRIEHARQARVVGKAAADDEGGLPHLVKPAGVPGKPALIGGEEAR